MASSSNAPISGTVASGKQPFVAEPALTREEAKIFQSQVLIPSPKPCKHALLGPLPHSGDESDKIKEVFPSYHRYSPRIFSKGPYVMDFMSNPNRVFRSSPPVDKNHTPYIIWLNKVMTHVLCKGGDTDKVNGFLEKMQEEGFEPDLVTYTLINSYCKK